MLALIKREIEQVAWNLIIPLAYTVCMVAIIAYLVAVGPRNTPPLGIPAVMITAFWLFKVLLLFAFITGVSQMNLDRTRKISTFLSTLATSRHRIFAARLLVGLLQTLVCVLLVILVYALLLNVYPCIIPIDLSLLTRLFAVLFLASLACYAIGLETGWTENTALAFIGGLIPCAVLLAVIVIKGFSSQTIVILLLVALAALARAWQKFVSTAL